jgi:Holliday junction resolvase RusA-like endonuclease
MRDPFILSISIDGEPIAKGRPRMAVRGGFARVYTPAKTRAYEDRIRCEAVNAMGGREPVDEAVSVIVTAYRAIPKSMPKKLRQAALDGILKPTTKPDADNNAKVLDALNGIIYRDDSLVTDLIVRKRYSARPRLTITVETEADFG